jgi:glycosyltransferase involved in cell wall biosynthesis
MKVMLIITRLDKGGSAEATMQLAEGLARKGYGVTLVTGKTVDPQEDLEAFQKRSGVPVVVVEAMRRAIHPVYDLLAFLTLRRLIVLTQPDIVHTHSSKAGILGRAAAYAAGCRCLIHSPHGHIFYGYFGRMATTIFIVLERMTARITDRVLTLTDLEREDHITRRIRPKGGFGTIPCGIDLERFRRRKKPVEEIREELGILAEATVIGWVGRFVPIKGPEVFIEVIAELQKQRPEVKGLMVGDGERRREAQGYAKQLGIEEDVIFTGMRDDIPDLMGIMDLFVLTSFNEGLGRVLIEAMTAGVPVVATRVGGVPEIIGEEETGLLVPPGDPCATVHAILRVLEESLLARRLVEAGRHRAERFSVTRMIEETERVYKDVIERAQVA